MRIASLRFHLSVPDKSVAQEPGEREKDLWGYVQEDSVADAFLLAIEDTEKWSGHERFFIVSSQTAYEEDTMDLIKRYWPGVPIKKGKTIVGNQGLFDCSKAAELKWKSLLHDIAKLNVRKFADNRRNDGELHAAVSSICLHDRESRRRTASHRSIDL